VKANKSASAAEFHCGYANSEQEILRKGNSLLLRYGPFIKDGPIIELGCGEAAFLYFLQRKGYKQLLGIESNKELLAIARTLEVPVIESDIWDYLRSADLKPAVYFYIDVMEHVTFDQNAELLSRLPVGSRIIIQTPYTESALGHRLYMNVPSHVAPYSPWVIKKMFERFGYRVVKDGSVDWDHPANWKNKIRTFLIFKIMGIDPELLMGGGNYYVVADRVKKID
jgi:trans-aconitate methyltransferase